ncbi:2c32b9f9-58ea-41c5-b5c0-bee8a9c3e35d [Sclerotinia trifoliorum]|uniref:2c32b9f9-58ea-41c5-b5c0-bee8a9c3e35d n=1 Tax=Sclerotinia trifoliorum TaxID=28548 RepID=A0A8H2ZWK1_9HELO|nr:2c32b9f9-58ea-41c5-b5c0-bee8a9c3e35d [Sclerotinia trifoliorum]
MLDAYFPRNCPPGTSCSFHLGPTPPQGFTRHILKIPAKSHGESTSFDLILVPTLTSNSELSSSSSTTSKLCSSTGELMLPGQTVTAFAVKTQNSTPSPIRNGGGDLFIPIPEACMEIAEHYFTAAHDSSTSGKETFSTNGKVTDVHSLWEVLYRRLLGEAVPLSNPYILEESHDYYGGRKCRNIYWEPDDNEVFGPLLEANPLSNSNFESIIQQHTSSSPSPSSSNFIPSPSDFPSIPWLWDMDITSIIASKSTANARHLDVCNMLAYNSDIYILRSASPSGMKIGLDVTANEGEEKEDLGGEAKSLNIPLSLCNRRRIWKILETARVGDVEEMEGSGRI